MNNLEIASALYEIADLLELKGADLFKIRAYRKAADALGLLLEEAEDLAQQRRLTNVPGIGKAIGAKIEELLQTGRITFLEELRQSFPPGVLALTQVPGLGAKTAARLYEQLGIDSLDRLEEAAQKGQIRQLPGLGPRKEATILAAIAKVRARSKRLALGTALPLAETLAQHLAGHPAVLQVAVAGSIRRRQETVGDLDLVISSQHPAEVIDYVARLPLAGERLITTEERLMMATSLGLPIDLLVVPPDRFVTAGFQLTGSAAHLAELGLSVEPGSPLTVEHPSGEEALSALPDPSSSSEAEIYRRLGLPYIPPELREGRGEVDAAREGRLPRLVTLQDLRGDLHCHTVASDGTASLLEMAEAARALGHQYLAICDHSHTLAIARGLTPERLLQQIAEIRALNQRWTDFRLLAGTEVDILKDGTLDFPDELLAQLDLVVASIHSHMYLPEQVQTQRLLRAIHNPYVHIIGHPTGRVIGRREPYELEIGVILEACAATGTALEISASPARLDLSDQHARLAKAAGVKLAINTDAHTTGELELLPHGIDQARRAWLEPSDLLNGMPLPELLAWLARPKGN